MCFLKVEFFGLLCVMLIVWRFFFWKCWSSVFLRLGFVFVMSV